MAKQTPTIKTALVFILLHCSISTFVVATVNNKVHEQRQVRAEDSHRKLLRARRNRKNQLPNNKSGNIDKGDIVDIVHDNENHPRSVMEEGCGLFFSYGQAPVESSWLRLDPDIDPQDGETHVFGKSIALSSNGCVMAIGSPGKTTNGDKDVNYPDHFIVAALAPDNVWRQLGQTIKVEEKRDSYSEVPVALSDDGSKLALSDLDGSGSVRVYTFDTTGSTWVQLGNDMTTSLEYTGRYGSFVTMSGDGMTVAAMGAHNNPWVSGIFILAHRFNGTSWEPYGEHIKILNRGRGDSMAMSSDGNTIAVGQFNFLPPFIGIPRFNVYVYKFTSEWLLTGTLYEYDFRSDFSRGVALSANGETLAIGAKTIGDDTGDGFAGVYSFNATDSTWLQMEKENDVSSPSLETKVAISDDGQTLAVGEENEIVIFGYNGEKWVMEEALGDWSPVSMALSGDGRTIASGNGESVAVYQKMGVEN